MKCHFFLRLVSLAVLTLLSGESAKPQNISRQSELEGLAVTMSLVKDDGGSEKSDWPDEDIRLTVQVVPVNGKTIQEILLDAHILPDVEAFAVVYALNPELQKLRNLAVTQIRIPKLEGGPKLQTVLGNNFVVLLTVEKERKQRFNDSVQRLKKSVETASRFGPEKFQNTSVRDAVIKSVKSSSEILGGINERLTQRFGRPITSEVLTQLIGETHLLNLTLEARTGSEAKFNQTDQEKLKAIESDLKRKGRTFSEVGAAGDAPDRYPEVDVFVETLRGGRRVPFLRVYFVPPFLKDDASEVQPFGSLTTDREDAPTKRRISSGTYCFWAARDPDKRPVTNEQCQAIYTDPKVQLTVIR